MGYKGALIRACCPYAYSRQKLTVQTDASYYAVEDGENFTELGASVYWKTNGLSLAGGTNLYTAKNEPMLQSGSLRRLIFLMNGR